MANFAVFVTIVALVIQSAHCATESVWDSAEVCEGEQMKIDCPDGMRIRIEEAFFGRNDTTTCLRDGTNNTDVTCNTQTATEWLTTFCNEKQNCSTLAMYNFFGPGNDCPDTSKFLQATWTCERTEFYGLMCEASGGLPLECPENTVIAPFEAFYGRRASDNNSTCPHENADVSEDCVSDVAIYALEYQCAGKQFCEVHAQNYLYGDPCPDVYKYLSFSYTCKECRNEYLWDAMCDLWALTGYCETNSVWMVDNCRRSCYACAQEPPLCTNYAGDGDCEYWVSQGHCDDNTAWMIPYCYKSCTECDAPVSDCVNTDGDSACNFWLSENPTECSDNPGYMMSHCTKACFQCNEVIMCDNQHDYTVDTLDCDYWASQGECSSNPAFMYTRCSAACLQCTLGGPISCVNNYDDAVCEQYEQEGQCASNPEWMMSMCWKSCTDCKPQECLNSWAVEEMDGDSQCWGWAYDGECSGDNWEWMQNNCYAACSGCQPRCINWAEDALCEMWRNEGECHTNYEYMSVYCYKACFNCFEDGEPESRCENAYDNQTACDIWAREGECRLNPDWMVPYCRRSCAACNPDDVLTNFIGRKALSGERAEFTQDKTFIMPYEFPVAAKLTHFIGFFVTDDPFRVQVWRPDPPSANSNANHYDLVYEAEFRANGSMIAQTMVVPGCVFVNPGDRLGFTADGVQAPIAHFQDASQPLMTYVRTSVSQGTFSGYSLHYHFSYAAAYTTDMSCASK